ncbi:ABC transporter ATP-binding protein [Romboutsia ilealis]|uniref:ABC transporter ATP-binding protein n=1 Tax=Romboutsia faecis TaxID=2764597 RepID=A0ABR7JQK4_9FIRM|nr:ABC transporter ATP-binding protein [Romboutsia faecis]MBC5997196.1 ABC transporter ATP-binding protein [Romboutsia faecis]MRN23478.1 ABC transporter ATP-binding protein [Romboutsia ilealis]
MDKEVLLTLNGVKNYFPVKDGALSKAKNYVKAVNDVNLKIYKGETLGLVGESGCGKTTLGKTILQLYKATDGEIIYNFEDGERDLTKLKKDEMDLARKKIQIVFQDPHSSLNPSFTIYQSLSDPLKKFGVKSKEERRKIIGDLLEAVNMRREYMDRYPHEFSGGQRQRIGIARALSINPELVICDEAVSALDVSIQAQVLNLLKDLKEKHNLTYIFITHDLSVVEYISDRIAVMYLGKIVELADAKSLYKNTLHPYTKALLSAIPVADINHKKERIVLEGDVPSPMNPPSGCFFHPRCKHCMDICKSEAPQMKSYTVEGKEHFVSCHLASKQIEEGGLYEEAGTI